MHPTLPGNRPHLKEEMSNVVGKKSKRTTSAQMVEQNQDEGTGGRDTTDWRSFVAKKLTGESYSA